MKSLANRYATRLFCAAAFIPLIAAAAEMQSDKAAPPFKARVPVTVINTKKNAVPVKVVNLPRDITHLNVRVGEIVNLESNCIPADNSLSHRFFYDGPGLNQFVIPQGYSFVVTDIIAHPSCAISGNPTDLYLALVEDPQAVRSYTIRF